MYAVLRVAKLKTMGEIAGLGHHNERTRETRNADDARRQENVRLVGTGDWCGDAQRRLDDAPTIRANAVLAIEHVLTASRDFYGQGDTAERSARLADWTERSMIWPSVTEAVTSRNLCKDCPVSMRPGAAARAPTRYHLSHYLYKDAAHVSRLHSIRSTRQGSCRAFTNLNRIPPILTGS